MGLIFAISVASMLMAHQASIFGNIMWRTTSQIQDVRDAEIWGDGSAAALRRRDRALSDNDLYRFRGVEGVEWAVRFYKGMARVRMAERRISARHFVGTRRRFAGGRREMLLGSLDDLRRPDAVIVDLPGYQYLFPGQPLEVGKTLEMNDRRAVIVGICKDSQPFQTFPSSTRDTARR